MHQRIIALYEATAAAWDAARRRELSAGEEPFLEAFATAVAPGASVLDIGCGGGEPIARRLIEAGFAVTGVDSSPSLIALCRQRFPSATWHVDDMRALNLGRRFDGLLAWHSLFHLHPDDQRALFPRLAAHAAPGAVLMFTSGDKGGEAIGEWEGQPLYHASLAPEEYRALLAANGFEETSFAAGQPVGQGPSVWTARSLSA